MENYNDIMVNLFGEKYSYEEKINTLAELEKPQKNLFLLLKSTTRNIILLLMIPWPQLIYVLM